MAKKGQTFFCEICKQKVVVVDGGFGVLVCCGKEMTLVGKKDMMSVWTSAHKSPEEGSGVHFICGICGQKINVIYETTGILECCGQRMMMEEVSNG
ncbi:hypothetical protein KsCSTR_45590 [Candidatus Kuenenia stuttgartiensis]|uniref:Desulfoferrodoxin N-terminal domain-containing protein n=1 Tax=Kuenenia stuttgartiensis TaxID=174633 RepID=Q1PWH9_KUEST|nr:MULTISPECIES: hypothetical protein [Kuenenia]MBE7545891.1 hypothetical protein [Planctomycetia bacterium]MBW7942890.1 hypothetical protein [Candidatus Kuenenia stuttgartiensis]MBZ0193317.1 hypothetical protein [Candidatus Kuenenia stuttgartiensis]MCF6152199.1 hypothetical protein [Candidatus Kuenenia stuttgartiensis]MCL4727352.1 hypothetical protein [Candidatus Kuenenia stuttgartiensis]